MHTWPSVRSSDPELLPSKQSPFFSERPQPSQQPHGGSCFKFNEQMDYLPDQSIDYSAPDVNDPNTNQCYQ